MLNTRDVLHDCDIARELKRLDSEIKKETQTELIHERDELLSDCLYCDDVLDCPIRQSYK